MKLALAAAIVGAVAFAYVAQSAGPSNSTPNYDVNRDGYVTLGDVLVVLAHVGETPGTPGPCVNWISLATPQAYYNAQGTQTGSHVGFFSAAATSSWGMTAIAGGRQDAIAC